METIDNENDITIPLPTGRYYTVTGRNIGAPIKDNPTTSQYQIYDSEKDGIIYISDEASGTKNTAEFFGVIKVMQLLEETNNIHIPIYYSSDVVPIWINKKRCGTWSRDNKSTNKLDAEFYSHLEEVERYLHSIDTSLFTLKHWRVKSLGYSPSKFNKTKLKKEKVKESKKDE